MSAHIYYQPVKGQSLTLGGPSSFIAAMTRALGGEPPWELNHTDRQVLHGLSAGLGEEERHAIDALLEAIECYDDIRVWVRW